MSTPELNGKLKADNVELTAINEVLRASEEKYRALYESLMDAFVSVDMDGRVRETNVAYQTMLGYSMAELRQLNYTDLTPEKWHAIESRIVTEQILPLGYSTVYEKEYRKKDGTVFPVELRTFLLRNASGQPAGMWAIVRDITERKRADKALRDSEQLLREAQNIAHVGSYVLDVTTGAWSNSDELDRIFGLNKTDPHTVETWAALLHPADRATMTDYFQNEVVGLGLPFNKEYRIVRHNDRAERWVHGLGKLEYNNQGRPQRMIGTIQDITERKQWEAERDKLTQQLQQAQKMESVGRLAGGVAHDFNNMLGVILGHLELALDQVGEGEALHAELLEIRKAAKRSADLTRQLLAFGRKQTIAPKTLDLNDTVTGMLKMIQRIIGENITLTWKPGPDLWPVRMDPSQIDQIIANLCVNARDAISGVGHLTIESKNRTFSAETRMSNPEATPGDYVMLSVSDNGCGMDTETQLHLFEPFFTTKEVGKGTGLGLSTIYGIVKQNNGFITVYSEPGVGTTFSIHLPRHHGKLEPAAVPVRPGEALRGHETILLVEDEPTMMAMTKLMLERLGYTVMTAETPGAAIQLAQSHSTTIDILFTDVIMPEMNGQDLARVLLARHPHLKCLFMSAYTSHFIVTEGVLETDVHFIQKPFSKHELSAKLRDCLGGR